MPNQKSVITSQAFIKHLVCVRYSSENWSYIERKQEIYLCSSWAHHHIRKMIKEDVRKKMVALLVANTEDRRQCTLLVRELQARERSQSVEYLPSSRRTWVWFAEARGKKSRHGNMYLKSKHWGVSRKTPGACWTASLVYLLTAGPMRDLVFLDDL